ncbi:esterase/lipase family protein [Microbacterium sp. Root180]|uniref:esterase/lipase family protein n=1 Tax=Microbacterium sp. Root180 TaxID=1736483 RepID=UPI0006F64A7E|nr:alpha/beta hydrolase [Microbacterium sp. Root180]KRB36505.1 hypothetical protein ASD93_10585 [Microbacterium sp. Root180]
MTPAGAAPNGGKPWSLQRALWWTADYVYAARRQLAILATPWAIGRRRPTPPAWRVGSPGLPEVVLLPGVYEHWTFLRPLGDALAAAGHRVRVVHGLGVNRRGIPETAERLSRVLADLPVATAGRVLVAHSKGGLIGKHLLVKTGVAAAAAAEASAGGDPAAAAAAAPPDPGRPSLGVLGLVAVATPFGGARRARLFLVPSIRAFLPSDETIVMLGRETSVNGRIVSVFAPYDPHIPEGSALDGATNIVVPAPGHFRVLGSTKTHDAVLEGIGLLAAH